MVALVTALAGLAGIRMSHVAARCQNPQPRNGKPTMAAGYQSKVLIGGLAAPRHIALDAEGNLLVAEQDGPGIQRIVLEDNGGINICAGSPELLISNGQVR